MERLGFYYDMTTCVGCGACQVACKDINHLNPGEFYRRVETLSICIKDNPKLYHYSGACNHCGEPACVNVCSVGAMYKAEDGTVRHDDGRCIGCGACMWNCPYGSISFSKTKGVAQKCESCYERREKGQVPACVAACITHALKFGNLDEINEDFEVQTLSIFPSPDQTDPSIRICFPGDSKDKISNEEKGGTNGK